MKAMLVWMLGGLLQREHVSSGLDSEGQTIDSPRSLPPYNQTVDTRSIEREELGSIDESSTVHFSSYLL